MSKTVQQRPGVGAAEMFEISRQRFWYLWQMGRVRLEYEVIPPSKFHDADPDAFTEYGGEHAIERWADDGGRA